MSTDPDTTIGAIWTAIIDLHRHDGIAPLSQLPGPWERRCGEWLLVANGQRAPMMWRDIEVAPFTVYVEFNGWPAGIISPYTVEIAAGEAANAETFIAAIRAEIGVAA